VQRWLGLAVLAFAGFAAAAEAPTPAVPAPLAPRSLLLDVCAVPGGGLVAVGERGHVLVSNDQGESWTQRPVPARSNLTAVTFVDREHGWAVGHDEVILRTSDGGATWLLSHYAPERQQPLLAVRFEDAAHGLAVGAFSTVYATADGGASWQAVEFVPEPLQPLPAAAGGARAAGHKADLMRDDEGVSQPHLNALARGGDGALYLAAEAGHLYRSTDGGRRWSELPSPYQGSFFGIVPLEGRSLLVFGLRGHLYRSDDAGGHWRVLDSHTVALLGGGTRLADGTVVIVGLAGTVLVSTDGGQSFALRQQPDRKGFAAVAPSGEGVVIVGESGVRRLSRAELGAGS
jgi:photosystem II stability/assembly factor-like uncharacterized protein